MEGTAMLRVPTQLMDLLPTRRRRPEITFKVDGASTVQHCVESLGIPRTEIGSVRLGTRDVGRSYLPKAGDKIDVCPIQRPQRLQAERFVLDVHLGSLARRMRLLGIDAAYRNAADDADLIDQATDEDRVLLTRDRGILRQRRLPHGAYVRGDHPEDQFADVLDRFRPALAPWTRCVACNGMIERVDVGDVADRLMPGTLGTYNTFARCMSCERPYWRGAHARRLEAVIEAASRERAVG